MKKILSKLGIAAIIATAAIVAGCSNGTPTTAYDTIEQIEAPSLQGKTLPGINYVSWSPVTGAAKYRVYRNGNFISELTPSNTVTTELVDIAGVSFNLIDGVNYEYAVEAIPSADFIKARTAYSKTAMSKITLKANVPTAEEFAESYKGYFEELTKAENPAFKVKQVTSSIDSKTYARITLNTKPEFNYKVFKYLDNDPTDILNGPAVATYSSYNDAAERELNIPITGAGEWNYLVYVTPKAGIYEGKKVAAGKLSVPKLDVSQGNPTAKYIDAGKTAKIYWTPATKNGTNEKFATTSYTVYRFANATWTKLTGTIASETDPWNNTTYFVTDTLTDNTQSYSYYVVLTDGKFVANTAAGTLSAYSIDNGSSNSWGSDSAAEYIDAGKTVRITWKPAKDSTNKDFATTDYTVYRVDVGVNNINTYTPVSGTITAAKINETVYYYATDTVPDNTKGYNYVIDLKLKATQWQWVNAYTSANAATPSITATAINLDNDNYSNDVYLRVKAGKAGETIKVYKVNTTKVVSPSLTLSTVLDADYTELDLTKFTGPATDGYLEYYDKNLAEGSWKYMIEETAKDKKAVRNNTTVQISAIPTVSGFNLTLDVGKYAGEQIYGTENTIIQNAKFSIAVTDYVAATEKFANYTYKVQYSKIEKLDKTSYSTYGKWTDIATLKLVKINTSNSYKGAAEITLGEGAYSFRVVKTDSASGSEVIKYYTGTNSTSVTKQWLGSAITFSSNSTENYVYVDTNKNYGNYKFELYQQTLKEGKPVTDYTAVNLSAFAETSSGSGTYRAKYGALEQTATATTTAPAEQKTYNYLLVVTDKDDNVSFRSLNGLNIK